MGEFSLPHLLLLGAVVVMLFGGKGRISSIMGDIGKGVGAFRKGLADDTPAPSPPADPVRAIARTSEPPSIERN